MAMVRSRKCSTWTRRTACCTSLPGKEKDSDPYFTHYYRVNFDGSNQQLLTPENADHAITPSPDGSTFVDVYSTRETPETVVLRDNTGKVIATLAHQDISRLLAAGWKPP